MNLQLDYTIDIQNDRIQHVNNIIKNMEENKQEISDYEIQLMSDYILFSPDSKPLVKKTSYRFYTEKMFNDKLKKEKNIEEYNNNDNGFNNDSIGEVIDFLERNNENTRVETKQVITKKDLNDKDLKVIKEYEDYIKMLRTRIENIKKTSNDKRLIYLYAKHIGLCRQDQLISKDILKGTIYMKKVNQNYSKDSFLQYFNFNNKDAIKALLKVQNRSIFTDIGILMMDLNKLIDMLQLKSTDSIILNMWRNNDSTESMIAHRIGLEQPNVHRKLNNIIKKIMDKHKEEYIDYINLNYKKGVYKKCPKCNEIKLIRYFGKCKSRIDGLQVYCKKCRTSNK